MKRHAYQCLNCGALFRTFQFNAHRDRMLARSLFMHDHDRPPKFCKTMCAAAFGLREAAKQGLAAPTIELPEGVKLP